jgi:O-antigen biosynthesis protein
MKVCIITPDITGPIRNGGIGTACHVIANVLAQNGFDITILYARGDYTETEELDVWRVRFASERIELVGCPEIRDVIGPHEEIASAWRVLRWLEGRHFDLLYVVEWSGVGGLVALARRMGLGFHDTVLIAGVHSPTLWHLEGQRSLAVDRCVLARDTSNR